MNLILSETRLNGLHLLADCIYADLHSAWHDELRILTAVVKSCEKDTLCGFKSFKVIEFVTNRKIISNHLLVANSNLDRISHSFGVRATYLSKIASGTYQRYGFPGEYVDEPYITKSRYIMLSDNESGMTVCSFVLTQYRRVSDRQTGKQTDGQTEMI